MHTDPLKNSLPAKNQVFVRRLSANQRSLWIALTCGGSSCTDLSGDLSNGTDWIDGDDNQDEREQSMRKKPIRIRAAAILAFWRLLNIKQCLVFEALNCVRLQSRAAVLGERTRVKMHGCTSSPPTCDYTGLRTLFRLFAVLARAYDLMLWCCVKEATAVVKVTVVEEEEKVSCEEISIRTLSRR